jgi:hypothetical protein
MTGKRENPRFQSWDESVFFFFSFLTSDVYNNIMKFVNRAYKYRFYPIKEQAHQLAHSFGCSRFVYNRFLKLRMGTYYEKKEKINYHKTSELLTNLKKEKDFTTMKEEALVHFDRAQELEDLLVTRCSSSR